MPNRLIRDGLLESEAILSLTIEARWLYIAICLTADDMGLFEATAFRLARRADLKKEHIERLLGMLNDVDLIRLYSDGKKTFGIIPKFKQRLQIKRIKYPIPPESLYLDDEDAIEKFNKLKNLQSKITVVQQIDNSYTTDAQPPEPEPEPEPENIYTQKKASRKTGISDNFAISDRVKEWAIKNKVFGLEKHFEYFVLQCKSKGYKYIDWDSAFMKAIRQNWAKVEKPAWAK